MAIEVIGITWLMAGWVAGPRTERALLDGAPSRVEDPECGRLRAQQAPPLEHLRVLTHRPACHVAARGDWRTALVYPLGFFLVAVPWPTLMEGPLMRALAGANAGAAVEFLYWAGVPAIQHGNIIETRGGALGIDDACSGIRSFQASLMLSLLFGEVYRVSRFRRVILCGAGLLLSILFNVIRTSLLSLLAAKLSVASVARWHDAAGVVVLVSCFLCLWFCALRLKKTNVGAEVMDERDEGDDLKPPRTLPGSRKINRRVVWVSSILLAWSVLAEVATELWYGFHESHGGPAVEWKAEFPTANPVPAELF